MAGCTGSSSLLGAWSAGYWSEKGTKAVPETFWLCWKSERDGVQRHDAEKANGGQPRRSRILLCCIARVPVPTLLPQLLAPFAKNVLTRLSVGGVGDMQAMRLAVRGMLPRNKLRDRLMKQRLLLYEVCHPASPLLTQQDVATLACS